MEACPCHDRQPWVCFPLATSRSRTGTLVCKASWAQSCPDFLASSQVAPSSAALYRPATGPPGRPAEPAAGALRIFYNHQSILLVRERARRNLKSSVRPKNHQKGANKVPLETERMCRVPGSLLFWPLCGEVENTRSCTDCRRLIRDSISSLGTLRRVREGPEAGEPRNCGRKRAEAT